MFAKQIIRSLGRPVAYTPPGGSVSQSIRAVIVDADESMRFHRDASVISSDASGSVLSSIGPRKGGTIETSNGALFEIYGITAGDVPGLLNLALMRLNLIHAAPLFDFTKPVLRRLGEDVEIDGKTVRAAVNRSGLFESVDEFGSRIEITRTVIAFSENDAPDVDEGSLVLIDGEEKTIEQLIRDGSGLIQGVL